MGCSASLIPTTTIQSIVKVDAATNTVDDDSCSNPLLTISSVKHLIEISTRTDDLQVDVKQRPKRGGFFVPRLASLGKSFPRLASPSFEFFFSITAPPRPEKSSPQFASPRL